MIEAVNAAHSVKEVGPGMVGGQAVPVFEASVELGGLAKGSAAQRRALEKLAEPFAKVELSLAEDGLPMRMRATLRLRGRKAGALSVELDILAINVPTVAVQPPPPDETISEAELKHLLGSRHPAKKRGRIVSNDEI